MQSISELQSIHSEADKLIRSVYTGKISWAAKETAIALKMRAIYSSLPDNESLNAWEALLFIARKTEGMVAVDPVIVEFGPSPGNTFPDGLLQIALHHDLWQRSLHGWSAPQNASPLHHFNSLTQHLFLHYDVPSLFISSLFEGFSGDGELHRKWLFELGTGKNIRRCDELPLRLTEKMAHFTSLAPSSCTINQALRYGQTLGLGGDSELAAAILESKMCDILPDEPFWESVIHFFVNYSERRYAQVGPLIDFIYNQRYGGRVHYLADGSLDLVDATEPDFTMKGRTWDALSKRMEDWHYLLARDAKRPKAKWDPSGIPEFADNRTDDTGTILQWNVVELLNTESLLSEGREQRHCVFSYANACKNGGTSIWSLRVRGEKAKSTKRLLTIEVNNQKRSIVQVKGRCNLSASQFRTSGRMGMGRRILREWAKNAKLSIGCGV